MRILVLGGGHIGSVIAKDLANSRKVSEVVVADNDERKLRESAGKKISTLCIGAENQRALGKLMKDFDMVSNALPGRFGFNVMKTGIKSKTNVVDASFTPENPLKLDKLAKKFKVVIIPDCGVAPGLSNILVGHAVSQLKKVDEVHIKVGGLPQQPIPPLGYRITWSVEDLLEEYTRKAKIVRNYEIKKVDALSGIETIKFKGVGELECFYTDGLRSLVHTIRGVKEMDEKTLRYPGHAEKIKALINCGLLNTKPMKIGGEKIAPRKFLVAILSKVLKLRKGEKDMTIMRVNVIGKNGPRKIERRFDLIDYYDDALGITSMARTTAYPCSIVSLMVGRGDIEERGVIPTEKLGMNPTIFKTIMDELYKRNVRIEETSDFF